MNDQLLRQRTGWQKRVLGPATVERCFLTCPFQAFSQGWRAIDRRRLIPSGSLKQGREKLQKCVQSRSPLNKIRRVRQLPPLAALHRRIHSFLLLPSQLNGPKSPQLSRRRLKPSWRLLPLGGGC